ncbi:sigma-54-dependent Fis family transcriptional regulator [Rhodanobacter sp. B2A1Ga4]|uniref:sigma-54 dependent transcriptional regulator n=1 Tax=Rhodanobacter TaxID=75309 RepID=UPI000D3C5A0D|nr:MULTISPECIES: sigma-54 dependent transcriptional regulator [Rhodanobacter]MBQ4854849.1 sigma-54-dependent Fis family transcriptional regulator [Rhodanobacter sp. B2A1Ga4]
MTGNQVQVARRCVVWFGQPTDEECDCLTRAGWRIRIGNAQLQGGVGMRRGDIVVAMADLRCSDADTIQAMGQLMANHPWLPWLALVSQEVAADTPEVERILRASADFFTAPVDLQRLTDTLMKFGNGWIPAAETADIPGIVGAQSPVMRATVASLRKYAPVDLPVLITGETGSGKEVAARALHDLSTRRGRPFVAINCGALPSNLVQSELFGHERGAFTGANVRRIGHFEAAAGGTVFLDEIGDLPLDAQASLLRLLQEGTLERVGSSQPIRLDVRVLAATHVDLDSAVVQGSFREDLYYRLNVLRLRMPALRERGGDIELLAQHFLDTFRLRHPGRARTFNAGARQAMREFSWPGNVRELINRVQRAAVVAESTLIDAVDLDLQDVRSSATPRSSLGLTRVSAEREAVLNCLRESHYNISECARRLKVSRVTVYRLCKKHQLELEVLRGNGLPFRAGRPAAGVNGHWPPATQRM